jgi:hypothetical protein
MNNLDKLEAKLIVLEEEVTKRIIDKTIETYWNQKEIDELQKTYENFLSEHNFTVDHLENDHVMALIDSENDEYVITYHEDYKTLAAILTAVIGHESLGKNFSKEQTKNHLKLIMRRREELKDIVKTIENERKRTN